MVASGGSFGLPFCHVEINAKKPLPKAYPKGLVTLGDHMRKRRLDLKLTQKEVANVIGVDEMTIVNWELNHTEPLKKHISKIVHFLGYDSLAPFQ